MSHLLAFRLPPARVDAYPDLERGNRVVLPSSWLHRCRDVAVLLCRLEEPTMGRALHVGCAGFDAPEDVIWLPNWLATELNILSDGVPLVVEQLATVPNPCTFVRLRPRDPEFYDAPDPRAQIEAALRHYPVVEIGTQLQLLIDGQRRYFDVRHLVPAPLALTTDTTCDLDLERGPAAVEWETRQKMREEERVAESARRMREKRRARLARFKRNKLM